MSDNHDTPTSAYEYAARDLLGALSHEFARAWQAGETPSIEEFLARANGCDRDELVARLVSIDIAFRRAQGEEISRSDYKSRYPGLAGSEYETIVYGDAREPHAAAGDGSSERSASRHRAAENLLFGILGWQMDFIGRDDLVHATRMWTANKNRSLAEILVDEGRLNPDDAALLWALVNKHVEKHGGSIARSLAAVGSDATLRRELSGLGDLDVSGSLEDMALGDAGANDATVSYRTALRPKYPGVRYIPLRPYARGGLGEVFVAYDSELGREVALKEIQRRYAHDHTSRTRFVLEGEITGGLEHPGIVSVYGLGVYPDGRPYYAMQLIRGESMKQAIERFHKREFAHADDWTFELRQLLERFKDVCHTLEYAHSRGVLHRDIKPSNVMLGRYGETLVIDWGLAKPLGRRDPEAASDETTLRPSSGHGSPDTMIGSAIGTPAYMSPEQARGRLDEISFKSDIFSLGATLYTILTNKAPYSGKLTEKLEQARNGDFPPPRRLNALVPRALEAVCLKAMALAPPARYSTCRELAVDVERWLAGEPVSAYREPIWTRGARWVRRHRTQVASAGLMLFALAAMTTVWQVREHGRVARLETEVSAIVATADALRRDDELAAAKVELTRAGGLLAGETRLAALSRDVETRLDEVNEVLAEQEARAKAATLLAQFREKRDEALFHGTLLPGTDVEESLAATLARAEEALGLYGVDLVRDIGPQYSEYYSPDERREIDDGSYELAMVYASALARPRPGSSAEDRQAAAERAVAIIEGTKSWAPPTRSRHRRLAACLELAGRTAEAKVELELGRQREPSTAVDFFLVGNALFDGGAFDEAFDAFTAALRIDPRHFWAQYFAAVSLLELGRPAEAVAHLTAAEGIHSFAWIPILRGYAYGRLGDVSRAEEEFDAALKMRSDEYGIYVNRGAMRLEAAQFDAAEADLKKAMELKPREYQAHLNLGELYRRQKKLDQALVFLDRAIELRPDAPKPYRARGQVHAAAERLEAALVDFGDALSREPADSPVRAELHFERAKILMRQERADQALAALDDCLSADDQHAEAHRLRADILLAQSRGQDALSALSDYLRVGEPRADVFQLRGFERAKRREFDGAIADYTAALELDPLSALTLGRRGWAYVNQAFEIALADFDAALAVDPKNGDLYCGRGFSRVKLGRYREAVEDAERALECGPPDESSEAAFSLPYNAACIYAQAAARVHFDLAAAERDATADRFTARSIELLTEAVTKLPDSARATIAAGLLESDEALAPVRAAPAFQALLEGLKSE